jgi:putative ABC transport system ATP-binding protein
MAKVRAIDVPHMIRLRSVTKEYAQGGRPIRALDGVELTVVPGEFVSIVGPSGSGKSTMLHLIGGLDRPSGGEICVQGRVMSHMTDYDMTVFRRRHVGFVFQSFNLLPRTTALEQVELPLVYAGAKDRRRRALEALESVGLGDRVHHKPTELSGGQQQRVAIARALVMSPSIILADEPTGNLDSHSSEEIMALFQALNSEQGITVVFVTHEPDIAQHTRRIIHVRDGLITSDEPVLDQVLVGRGRRDGEKRDGKEGER